ncbi:lysosomal Pro-X carboxypeptidase-like [Corticium candelabrum]|uniref:lysosomal Pro-X carboxypeptidase-like n=1 Tax=Corticium candelabrum TaxID=121492 RepID=UPI002E322F4C|nr:lysosomal Pro-X carboxypeptidase-like [Corticium candelabrum]
MRAELREDPKYNYTTKYFTTFIDHFGFATNATFRLRYLVNDQYWRPERPIFFYTGNEGDITLFSDNTGFVWEIAPEFEALVIFAEHRYYGESLPFGNESFKDAAHTQYLTSEQALADFATLLIDFKQSTEGAAHSPVVAFGGSYGGMLASWFRMKYPNVVGGAIAASAPILQFTGVTPCDSFSNIVSADFCGASETCCKNIKTFWSTMNDTLGKADGLGIVSDIFRLCKPLSSERLAYDVMEGWISNILGNFAMCDYPYPANFLTPLPAHPINKSCEFLNTPLSGDDLLKGVANVLNLYFNYTGSVDCLTVGSQGTSRLGDQGWGYQVCTEMVMPMCSIDNMFPASRWDYDFFAEECRKQWGTVPRPMWIPIQYGGKDITAHSNIVFSNGNRDPWSGGGVLTNMSASLIAIVIEGGAHHLDLRASNPADPPSVIEARLTERAYINEWIHEWNG